MPKDTFKPYYRWLALGAGLLGLLNVIACLGALLLGMWQSEPFYFWILVLTAILWTGDGAYNCHKWIETESSE